MPVPTDRKYLKSHEWFKPAGKIVTVGITQFAADELTDVTYVSLPSVGKTVTAGETFGEIESVKATSDLYTAVSGKVVETNPKLADNPELVNNDPFGEGWMVKIEATDLAPLDALMDGAAYSKQIGG